MIEEETEFWSTGLRERPFGRGISLHIDVDDLAPIRARLEAAGIAMFRPLEDAWYRTGKTYSGNRQFLVQDPGGYLLRFFEDIGTSAAPTSGRIVG
jgi:hypothetical protein